PYLFVLSVRRPPRSSLCPYTTLFRSGAATALTCCSPGWRGRDAVCRPDRDPAAASRGTGSSRWTCGGDTRCPVARHHGAGGRCGRAALRGASTDHGADSPVARGRDRAGCLRLPRDSRLPPAPTGGRRRGWAGRGVPAAGRPPWCRVRPRRPRPFRSRRGVLPRATVGCGGLARPAPAPVTARAGRVLTAHRAVRPAV